MKFSESKLQKSCVKWFKLQYPKEIILAIPNAGKRSVTLGKHFKAEGLLPGAPDLFIASANKIYHGLFIEMKTEKTGLSENQKKLHPKISEQGYKIEVAHSFDEFKAFIDDYFSSKATY